MNYLKKAWLSLQYRFWMVEAYLLNNQGRGVEVADCKCRALECERQIHLLELNHD